jgi:hypothetical protein
MTTLLTSTPPRRAFWWVPYIHLLRVQLLTAAALVLGPLFASSSPLLNGLFDLDYGSEWMSGISMAVVSLAAFATAWTLLASSVTTIINAPMRFGSEPITVVRFPIRWPEREVFALTALIPISIAIRHSWQASGVSPWPLVAGAFVGLAAAVGGLLVANRVAARLQRDLYDSRVRRPEVRLLRWVVAQAAAPNVRDGFIDADTGELRPGHMLAWVVFVASLIMYAVIGVVRALWIGYQTPLSTLACALLLILMLCWFFAGLAFFFDRYRAPVLAIAAALLVLIGGLRVPGDDHTYHTWQHAAGFSPYPHQVLKAGPSTPIVVAATGGGIQAAAWTARVLTGIDQALPETVRDRFSRSVRVISSVSGGGVGAMYFVENYRDGGFDHARANDVVAKAEASSLDDVAWGAVYPDLIGNLFPPVRLWLGDRGDALERAWTRDARDAGTNGVGALLAHWREQVWSADRPANIFNATLVDTGERLLMGTSRVGWREEEGLHNYEDLYPDRDLQVVTAARLAASFTYVSPAARPDHRGEDYHVVDGGYYDDYGTTTLTEWLDEGLEGVGLPRNGGTIDRVLVVQIRSSPPESHNKPSPGRGYFYQAWAPVATMLNVRSTGQLSHNDEEFARLQRLWADRGVEIDNVVFSFCGEHPPLSWHLTGGDKREIEGEWQKQVAGPGVEAVRAFLDGQPIRGTNPEKPYDAAMIPCADTTDGTVAVR